MSAYEITVSITPLCPSCGKELSSMLTEARPSSHPFERDNPSERTARRVFVSPCTDCYEYKQSPITHGHPAAGATP